MGTYSIDAYYDQLPEKHMRLILECREVILRESNQITEKLRYKIPFFYLNTWLCYLNVDKKRGPLIGFLHGTKLEDNHGLLQSELKMVRHLYLKQDMPHAALVDYLRQSIALTH
jgi:hypothetical protein